VAAKQGIVLHQKPLDTAVLNADDPEVSGWSAFTRAEVHGFSLEKEIERGAFLRKGAICGRPGGAAIPICLAGDLLLPGRHNVANALAASAAALALGVAPAGIAGVLRSFRGAEHRLELVAEIGGVRYVNDSIATSPDRAIAALNAFEAPILLIAGGYDKGIPFDPLGPHVARKVRQLFLIGATEERIADVVGRHEPRPSVRRCDTLAGAVDAASSLAAPGDVVLLSPACASYGMFRNFEDRGRQFKELVMKLRDRG
jgi:UDP-N-acetylmuramoylalanine--D-glutamate ligase